jgi:hypothetical protein
MSRCKDAINRVFTGAMNTLPCCKTGTIALLPATIALQAGMIQTKARTVLFKSATIAL